MFNFLRKKNKVDILNIGTFSFDGKNWYGMFPFKGNSIELSLDGAKSKPDDFAVEYLKKHFENLEDYWNLAKKFTIEEFAERETKVRNNEFKICSISIHKKNSFDNGHLVFWFEIESDVSGGYYVSFINEKPNFLHRE